MDLFTRHRKILITGNKRDQLSDEDLLIFEKLREEIIQEKIKNKFGGD
jgi:hypothetical protein